MKRSALAIAIATMLLGSTAIAEHPITQPAASQPTFQHEGVRASGDQKIETTSGDTTPSRDATNRSDAKFLKEFAQMNAFKVDTGKLAEWKAEDAEVKAFATHMVEAHSKTITKIAMVAAQSGIDVKAKPDFMQKAKSNFLDMSVGGSFDRAYLRAMVNDHENVVELLEREIADGKDASVKQLALEALADVQKHLNLAQALRAKVSAEQNAIRLARNSPRGAERVASNP